MVEKDKQKIFKQVFLNYFITINNRNHRIDSLHILNVRSHSAGILFL